MNVKADTFLVTPTLDLLVVAKNERRESKAPPVDVSISGEDDRNLKAASRRNRKIRFRKMHL
jgi:hypothetical protein